MKWGKLRVYPWLCYAANLRLSLLSSCSTVESRRSVSRGVIEFRLRAPATRVWYALRSRAESLPRKARALRSTLMVIVIFFASAIFERIRAVAFQSIERSFSFGCFIVQPPKPPHFRSATNYDGATGGYTATRPPIQLVWFEEFPTREEAKVVEAQLKKWSRRKKVALIGGRMEELRAAARKDWVSYRQRKALR